MKYTAIFASILFSITALSQAPASTYQIPTFAQNTDDVNVAPDGQSIDEVLEKEQSLNGLHFDQRIGNENEVVYTSETAVNLFDDTELKYSVSYVVIGETVENSVWKAEIPGNWTEAQIADEMKSLATSMKEYVGPQAETAPLSTMGAERGDLKYCLTDDICMRTLLMRQHDEIVVVAHE